MKKLVSLFSIMLLAVLAFSMIATSALAAGGKVRGCDGIGAVNQNQEDAATWIDFENICE